MPELGEIRQRLPWPSLGENEWPTFGENRWPSLGEKTWPPMGENTWPSIARKMTKSPKSCARWTNWPEKGHGV
jgi:hypothetical protein